MSIVNRGEVLWDPMKCNSPSPTVLVLALLLTAGSTYVPAQRASGGAGKLVVTVTVPPICTVAVTPGEWSAEEAIDVQCRNLAADQPQPVVSDATVASDATPEISGNSSASTDPVAMVVINF
jgi:hypothetical protein